MNANQDQPIPYAVFENGIQFPIVDITHPLFNASIDEQAYHLSCLKSVWSIESLKKMPGFIRNIFVKMSNVDNSYLSGMRTLLYKLGPDLSRGIKLGFRDKWAVKQTSFMGLRIRLRDLCRRQSELLQTQLKQFPERNLCFFNITGGGCHRQYQHPDSNSGIGPRITQGTKDRDKHFKYRYLRTQFRKTVHRCFDAAGGTLLWLRHCRQYHSL
ncbi:hypothetical protein J2T12_005498 [Paenibacillus anaericanus]|uniref:hypothetical protein n=1 Tax=Paenibacillus anaericanus TaxID=170367 RepID=UPI00277DC5FA|nr:hypothetical protein [Paenibacillus anaericanus]MDQ0092054.1 hypothetical protein [Paenibacillus anaericanus]